jgi:hypothetical protein
MFFYGTEEEMAKLRPHAERLQHGKIGAGDIMEDEIIADKSALKS